MSKPFGLTHSVTLLKMSRSATLGVLANARTTCEHCAFGANLPTGFALHEIYGWGIFFGMYVATCAMRRGRLVIAFGDDIKPFGLRPNSHRTLGWPNNDPLGGVNCGRPKHAHASMMVLLCTLREMPIAVEPSAHMQA